VEQASSLLLSSLRQVSRNHLSRILSTLLISGSICIVFGGTMACFAPWRWEAVVATSTAHSTDGLTGNKRCDGPNT